MPMDVESLARLVDLMRQQQKRFFAGDKAGLSLAQDMERRVDAAVKEILHPTRTLFDPPPPCDHAWQPTDAGDEQCDKCHEIRAIKE